MADFFFNSAVCVPDRRNVKMAYYRGPAFEMEFRRLAESDLEAIAALYTRVFNEPPWNDEWTDQIARERLLRFMASPDALGIVAVDDDKILGFALGICERWIEGDHFHLKEMCTAPERQREGIGSAVLDALITRLRTQGVRGLYLQTAPGTFAENFYRKHGFETMELHTMVRGGISV